MIHAVKEHVVQAPIEKVFELVSDVAQYEAFIPWCLKSVVLEGGAPEVFQADLTVGFGPFEETYRSQVTCTAPTSIQVSCQEKPLKHLETLWRFEKISGTQTKIHFEIQFALHSRLFQGMVKSLLDESMIQVLQAFEKRLKSTY